MKRELRLLNNATYAALRTTPRYSSAKTLLDNIEANVKEKTDVDIISHFSDLTDFVGSVGEPFMSYLGKLGFQDFTTNKMGIELDALEPLLQVVAKSTRLAICINVDTLPTANIWGDVVLSAIANIYDDPIDINGLSTMNHRSICPEHIEGGVNIDSIKPYRWSKTADTCLPNLVHPFLLNRALESFLATALAKNAGVTYWSDADTYTYTYVSYLNDHTGCVWSLSINNKLYTQG